MKRYIFLIMIFFALVMPMVSAEYDWQLGDYPQFNEYAENLAAGENPVTANGVINELLNGIFGELIRSKALIARIMTIAAVAGLLKLLGNGAQTTQTAYFASYALMSAAVVRLLAETVGYGSEVIHSLCDFISKLAPVLLGLLAASGMVSSAAVFSPILSGAVYLFALVMDKIITPMVYLGAVLGIVGNLSGRIQLGSFNRLLRSVSRWILTALLTVFTGLCALYGFNAPVIDAIGAKTAKLAVGTLVPVVGGLLADTLETVVGGTYILKNAVGSAGMIFIVVITAAPVIKVWIILFLLRLCAALCEPLCDSRMSVMLQDAAESVGTVFSVMLTALMLFLISIGIILASTGM